MAGALKVYNPNTSSWEVVDYGPGMKTYSGADYTALSGTLNNVTWQHIYIDTAYKDTDSYNTGADEYFTVPTDGFYDITFSAKITYLGSTGEFIALIGPNTMTDETTAWCWSSAPNVSSGYDRRSASMVKWLAEGTQVKFMAYQSSGAGQTISGFMSIARLNGAKGDTGPAGPAGPTGPTGGGAETINDLTDVDTTGLADNHILRYNLANTAWEPEVQADTVSLLTDVDETGKTNDSILRWNSTSSKWEISTAGVSGFTGSAAVDAVYPVGSIYIETTGTNPGTTFGVGTWTAFGTGRMLVGYNSGDTDFNASEKTGGAKTHSHTYSTVIAHTHSTPAHSHGINDPSHVHGVSAHGHTEQTHSGLGASTWHVQRTASSSGAANTVNSTAAAAEGIYGAYTGISTQTAAPSTNSTGTTGSGVTTASSNVPPYIVVYMWKRTA